MDMYYPNLDVRNYRRLLQDFWGFYQPLERKLVVLADPLLFSPYSPQRSKASRLKQDLLTLGMTEAAIAALPLCGRLPAVPTPPRAFGVLYVIEGDPVGGRIADLHVLGKLGIHPSQGGSFFSTSEPLGDQSRQVFKTAMTGTVEEPSFQLLAVEAAVDTLDCFEAWLDYRHRPQRTNHSPWNSESRLKPFGPSHVDRVSGAA
jgi:heme oxygenase